MILDAFLLTRVCECPSRGHSHNMEREKGFEPSTSTLARLHSTTELLPHKLMKMSASMNVNFFLNALKKITGRKRTGPSASPNRFCLSYVEAKLKLLGSGGPAALAMDSPSAFFVTRLLFKGAKAPVRVLFLASAKKITGRKRTRTSKGFPTSS